MRTAQRLLVFGRVQGVGYRESLRAKAEAAGCTGWVRNRADGSVEAVIEGMPQDIASVLAWARRGPPAARVDRIQVAVHTGGFTIFEVLRTA